MILFVLGVALVTYAILLTWSASAGLASSSPIDWAAAVFVSLVSLTILTGWVGVVLASLGWFSPTSLGIVLLGVAALLMIRRRGDWKPRFQPVSRYEVLLGALLLACAVVYFRPHEYVLGSADAGSYVNIGASLARTGQLIVRDDWTRLLSDYSSLTLREQPPQWLTRHLQFVGWYIDDADPSRVIPQFYPFHPTLIAAGIGLAGLNGGLLVTPVWGVLSIAAIYFAARRCFGPRVGLLSAMFLAVTPTHIFFARYPTAEALTLLLVFSGLLAYQRLYDEDRAPAIWGIFGGAAFGAAFLTRIDLPLVAILLALALLTVRAGERWEIAWTAFGAALGILTVHALLHALIFAWPYTWNTYGNFLRAAVQSNLIGVLGALGVATALYGAIVLWRTRVRAADSRLGRFLESDGLRWTLISGIVALSIYAYFVRPQLEPIRHAVSWPSGNQFPILNGQNWVRLGWYLTPLGLLLATTGLAVILWRESLSRLGLFLSVGALTTIQYVYNIFNTPYHIYAMRRYVPIVIPMLMIYAAVAILAMVQARHRQPVRAVGAILAVVFIGGMLYQSRFVLPQRDLYGALEQVTILNQKLKPNAIIVISEPAESIFADTFGVPLRFIFGHDIATIRQDDARAQAFIHQLMAYADGQHRPVQLIAVDPIAPTVREVLSLQPVEMFPVTLQMLMNTFFDYPSVIQTAYYGIEIYDVSTKSPPLVNSPEETLIDIGTLDTRFIRSGFYYKEPLVGGFSARWTSREAALDIPLSSGVPVTIDLRAMIFRPEGAPAADVTVWLDGQEIGQFKPDETWQTFSFQARPKPARGISSLRFKTTTFNPASLKINGDTRDLGFLIDWVKVATG